MAIYSINYTAQVTQLNFVSTFCKGDQPDKYFEGLLRPRVVRLRALRPV